MRIENFTFNTLEKIQHTGCAVLLAGGLITGAGFGATSLVLSAAGPIIFAAGACIAGPARSAIVNKVQAYSNHPDHEMYCNLYKKYLS